MPPPRSSSLPAIRGYGFAISASLFAGALTQATAPFFGHSSFFEFFHMAVVLSAFLGGLGPGILAATLSFFMLDYFFIPPVGQFILGPHLFRLIIFWVVAASTSLLSGMLKKAKRGELEKTILEVSAREQRRLGQDLHDGLCQSIAGVRLMVEDMRARASDGPGRPEDLETLEVRLTDALDQAYAASRGLFPVELETNGLMSALQELAEKTSKTYPAKCLFRCPRPVAVHDNAVATHLFRIAQEAVVNGIKGGKAGRVNVRLLQRGPRVLLRVADNGTGIGNAPARKGMGLKIMEYRAQMIGAILTFRSRRKGVTLVTCDCPRESHAA